ncbi:hypothetical protein AgCh_030438 [Apium graveolens]
MMKMMTRETLTRVEVMVKSLKEEEARLKLEKVNSKSEASVVEKKLPKAKGSVIKERTNSEATKAKSQMEIDPRSKGKKKVGEPVKVYVPAMDEEISDEHANLILISKKLSQTTSNMAQVVHSQDMLSSDMTLKQATSDIAYEAKDKSGLGSADERRVQNTTNDPTSLSEPGVGATPERLNQLESVQMVYHTFLKEDILLYFMTDGRVYLIRENAIPLKSRRPLLLKSGMITSRPVTLIGFSLGARVIFKCLETLAKADCDAQLVERVFLLGSPLSIKGENWEVAMKVMSGRFLNAYSTNDWMLGVVFHASLLSKGLAGMQEVDTPGIENANRCNRIPGESLFIPLDYSTNYGKNHRFGNTAYLHISVAFIQMLKALMIGRTEAVTIRVVGVLKDWILIALSTVIFLESIITGLNITGYAIGKTVMSKKSRDAIFQIGEDTVELKNAKRRMIDELKYDERCLLKNYLRTAPDIKEISN